MPHEQEKCGIIFKTASLKSIGNLPISCSLIDFATHMDYNIRKCQTINSYHTIYKNTVPGGLILSISGKEDLRIQKTREAIHKTFEEMICEMDYEQISIKELTERARINRKTFYLHYNSLDDLLKELQNKMAENFIDRKSVV